MECIDKKLFVESPKDDTIVYSEAEYTKPSGGDMIRLMTQSTRSDTVDSCEIDLSEDHGGTWSRSESLKTKLPHADGTLRRHPRSGMAEPETGRYVSFMTEGVLPNDDPLEGLKNWYVRYRVSEDGGWSWEVDEPVIQQGEQYSADHPLKDVWKGKNCCMIGDKTCGPIHTEAGKILMPVQITPVGPDGEYHNPGGGYTYHESVVLIGTWAEDQHLKWDVSERVAHDPKLSTRGCLEPTIAQFPDGRILMVMRGSNGGSKDPECDIPGRKWYSVSHDGGYTWSHVEPWGYDTGELFFSPSSCSQLLSHSNGKKYWLGNICPENPCGNGPRYPIVIGEVDSDSLMLIEDSVTVIDDRGPDDSERLALSNFHATEDRPTALVHLYMSRAFAKSKDVRGSDAYLYRIEV
ncbi:MAG: sialidase family protein [Candidatus Brocadiia bacterium]